MWAVSAQQYQTLSTARNYTSKHSMEIVNNCYRTVNFHSSPDFGGPANNNLVTENMWPITHKKATTIYNYKCFRRSRAIYMMMLKLCHS